ncbi:MAG: ABC transporter ATP-binding protein, partial [Sedimentisphaerales bacterium]|nr:ABC transporter ATP-binding protein [Sedimentisphaerales bacterium]
YPAPDGVEPEMVLDSVSFSVMPGELIAVVGPSGSGKTTLLNIIGLLDEPTAGRVLFNGEDIFQFNDERQSRYRRDNIGIVFQEHNLLKQCTARENVLLGVLASGKIADVDRKRADELLAAVGLERYADYFPGQMSGGQCQRVALARAFMNTPSVILADEPTGSLDSKNAQMVIGLLCQLSSSHGTAIILVTHDMDIAGEMQRRIELKR